MTLLQDSYLLGTSCPSARRFASHTATSMNGSKFYAHSVFHRPLSMSSYEDSFVVGCNIHHVVLVPLGLDGVSPAQPAAADTDEPPLLLFKHIDATCISTADQTGAFALHDLRTGDV